MINGAESACCNWTFPYKYLCDGTLTVQVDAALYCHIDVFKEPGVSAKLDNVALGMKNMFTDTLFTDLTIKCGGEEFKVHKAVLASQSPVFRRMLESDMKEQRTNVIEISDTDPQVISNLLAYLYSDDAPDVDTLANKLLVIANKYALSQLFEICENKLKSDITLLIFLFSLTCKMLLT